MKRNVFGQPGKRGELTQEGTPENPKWPRRFAT